MWLSYSYVNANVKLQPWFNYAKNDKTASAKHTIPLKSTMN